MRTSICRAVKFRAGSLVAAVVLVAAVSVGFAPSASAQNEDPPESAELVQLRADLEILACPELDLADVTLNDRPPSIFGEPGDGVLLPPRSVVLQCDYGSEVVEPGDRPFMNVQIQLATRDDGVPFQCQAEPSEDRTNADFQRIMLGQVVDSAAIVVQYTAGQAFLDAHPGLGGAIESAFTELAERVAPFALLCQYEPAAVACPQLAGYAAAAPSEARLEDRLTTGCTYPHEDQVSSVEIVVTWATDRSSDDALRRACEDFGESPRLRVGFVGGDEVASQATWRFIGPVESLDPAAVDVAATAMREDVAAQATSCDEAGVAPVWTPLPPYLEAAFAPDRIDAPRLEGAVVSLFAGGGADLTVVGSPAPTDGTGAAEPAEPALGADPDTPVSSPPAAESGWTPVLRIVAIVALVLSLLSLVLTLLLSRRETRLRPRMDVFRIVMVGVVAVVSIVVFSKGAPIWAVVAALVVGGGLGWFQGRNLVVRLTRGRLMAQRAPIAVVAFTAGLVLTQVAGLLNRRGVIALGIALSFLSAATTAGLLIGRREKVQTARASAAAVGLIVLGAVAVVSLVTAEPAPAQETDADIPCGSVVPGERCAAHEHLIDLVPWDEIRLNGGLLWTEGKPWIDIVVPRALDTPPDPVEREVEWTVGDVDHVVTERFAFGPRDDGRCCSVEYRGSGSQTTAGNTTEYVAEGRLDDIGVLGGSGDGGSLAVDNQPGVPFDEVGAFDGEPEDACSRLVAGTVGQSERGQASFTTYTIDGQSLDPGFTVTATALTAPCDIDGYDLSGALALAPELPPREQRSSPCPARSELVPALAEAAGEPLAVNTLGRMFTAPAEALCNEGGEFRPMQFGTPGPGGTRAEFAFQFSTPETDAGLGLTAFADDSTLAGVARPADVPLADQCDVNEDGQATPVEPGERCELITMHKVNDTGSWIWVFTDNQTFDGPNVTVRASIEWATYWYSCHHCSPESPEIQAFLAQFHDVGVSWIDGQPATGSGDGAPTGVDDPDELARQAEALGVDGDLLDAVVDPDADDETRAASIAAIVGLLASTGMLGAALAESGFSATQLAEAFRRGGIGGLSDLLDPSPENLPPGGLLDENGVLLLPDDDGLYPWVTADGTEWLERADVEERIDAEKRAIAAREGRADAIGDEMDRRHGELSDADMFGDIRSRIAAENDEMMAEIRKGWHEVDEIQANLDARSEALARLEAAQAAQDLANEMTAWEDIAVATFEGSVEDLEELGEDVTDMTRAVVTAAADPENWRVVGETFAESVYDVTGLLAGGQFGDGAQSIVAGVEVSAEVAAALGVAFARDPIGTVAMLTPIQDFKNAVDSDLRLSERLGSLSVGMLDIAGTLSGMGLATAADDMVAAARAAEVAAQTARDAARAAEAAAEARRVAEGLTDAGLGAARVGDDALDVALLPKRDEIVDAISAAQARAAREGSAIDELDLREMREVRAIFQGGGMQDMGRLEATGGLSEEMAQAVVRMHDNLTDAAVRAGTGDAIADMERLTGYTPRQVLVGDSGSVGTARSVVTDADRTVVTVFDDADIDLYISRNGGNRAEAAEALQEQFKVLHQRNVELALNDPTDPAVVLARENGMTLGEAVDHLNALGQDDPVAAAARLTAQQMDTASYAGFGSMTQSDAYPAGFTRSRMEVQGSTTVYSVDAAGEVKSYDTSGQAIIDQHELERLRHTGELLDIDPTRIPASELEPLLKQQIDAIGKYDDAKSVAKAVDRVQYIAGRVDKPMYDSAVVDAAIAIRANPRATADVLAELGMSEAEFVAQAKNVVMGYGSHL